VGISNDDNTRAMFELYLVINIIELYMEKDSGSHQLPESHEKLSRILDLDNESTGFMSLV